MKQRIKELREKNANILTEARKVYDEITPETPADKATEIEARHDQMMDEHDANVKTIQRLERMADATTAQEERQEAVEREAREGRMPAAPGAADVEDRSTPSYPEVFRAALARGAHTLNADEQNVLAAVQRGASQSEIAEMEARAMSAGTPAEGGYFVPDEFSGELEKQLEDWGVMYSGATRQISTPTGAKMLFPTLDYTQERGEKHTENGAVTDDGSADPVIGQKELDAYIYNTPIVPFSLELLQDSQFAIEPLLAELFGESLGRTANDVLTNGDGSNKPEGILTAAPKAFDAAGTDALTADEMIDLVHSVNPAYRRSPMTKFQFNDLTLAFLRKLKDGQGNYLWQMGDVRTDEPNTILGHGYEINSAMPDIGAGNSPVLFGDHSRYLVRKVGSFSVIPFREKYMHKLQIGLMAFMRFDGGALNTTGAFKKITMAAS